MFKFIILCIIVIILSKFCAKSFKQAKITAQAKNEKNYKNNLNEIKSLTSNIKQTIEQDR